MRLFTCFLAVMLYIAAEASASRIDEYLRRLKTRKAHHCNDQEQLDVIETCLAKLADSAGVDLSQLAKRNSDSSSSLVDSNSKITARQVGSSEDNATWIMTRQGEPGDSSLAEYSDSSWKRSAGSNSALTDSLIRSLRYLLNQESDSKSKSGSEEAPAKRTHRHIRSAGAVMEFCKIYNAKFVECLATSCPADFSADPSAIKRDVCSNDFQTKRRSKFLRRRRILDTMIELLSTNKAED